MTDSTLHKNSTGIARVTGLADDKGVIQNTATVTLIAFVNRKTGATIPAITLPLTLAFVSGSQGDYEGIIPPGIGTTVGEDCIATFKAVGTQTYEKEWKETIRIKAAVA